MKSDPDDATIETSEYVDGDWRIIPASTFQRKYNLIYDVPDNPTKRIKRLCEGINKQQDKTRSNARNIRKKVSDVLREIRNAKQPERIATFEGTLSGLKTKRNISIGDKKDIDDELEICKKYAYSKYWDEYEKSYGLTKKKLMLL